VSGSRNGPGYVVEAGTMATSEEIIEAIKSCYDPEIPVNIWDLGLIYDLKQNDGRVAIKMTLTALGCPVGPMLAEEIKGKVGRLDGVTDVDVEIVFSPPWTPERLTDEGRLVLQSMGYPV
jgi:metal-sulfur cluster biosynthetic enzyme